MEIENTVKLIKCDGCSTLGDNVENWTKKDNKDYCLGCSREIPHTCSLCDKTYYTRDETLAIKAEFSISYDGASSELDSDLCYGCFAKKVVPALKELGLKFKSDSWMF